MTHSTSVLVKWMAWTEWNRIHHIRILSVDATAHHYSSAAAAVLTAGSTARKRSAEWLPLASLASSRPLPPPPIPWGLAHRPLHVDLISGGRRLPIIESRRRTSARQRPILHIAALLLQCGRIAQYWANLTSSTCACHYYYDSSDQVWTLAAVGTEVPRGWEEREAIAAGCECFVPWSGQRVLRQAEDPISVVVVEVERFQQGSGSTQCTQWRWIPATAPVRRRGRGFDGYLPVSSRRRCCLLWRSSSSPRPDRRSRRWLCQPALVSHTGLVSTILTSGRSGLTEVMMTRDISLSDMASSTSTKLVPATCLREHNTNCN